MNVCMNFNHDYLLRRRTDQYFRSVNHLFDSATTQEVELTLVQAARHRFLNLVKARYHDEFEHGVLESRPAFQILVDAATAAQDLNDDISVEWNLVSKKCRVSSCMY